MLVGEVKKLIVSTVLLTLLKLNKPQFIKKSDIFFSKIIYF